MRRAGGLRGERSGARHRAGQQTGARFPRSRRPDEPEIGGSRRRGVVHRRWIADAVEITRAEMSTKMSTKIPATVVTGFLGAGKTTLIQNLLRNANGRGPAATLNQVGRHGRAGG